MEKQIKQVHFQITRNCNLRCHFCGQWGKKGFFADSSGEMMTIGEWKNIIDELVSYRKKRGGNITVTVWGGEPLVSPYFDEIVTLLKNDGFIVEVITNGVFIDKHYDVLNKCVDVIYVSLDGPKKIHDAIRGEGVFEKVTHNLSELGHENVTVMSVITPSLTEVIDEFTAELAKFGIKRLYLHDMIGLDENEIQEYKSWMKNTFDIEAHDIESWKNEELFKMRDIKTINYGYEIEHKKHTSDGHCKSPFNHVHIAWNGNVLYCTDFYDFSAGNVKNEKLEDIFENQRSELFRREIADGKCVVCKHCSWRSKA